MKETKNHNVWPSGVFFKGRIFKLQFLMLLFDVQTSNFAKENIRRCRFWKYDFRTVRIHAVLTGVALKIPLQGQRKNELHRARTAMEEPKQKPKYAIYQNTWFKTNFWYTLQMMELFRRLWLSKLPEHTLNKFWTAFTSVNKQLSFTQFGTFLTLLQINVLSLH